jgi:hypothetical protein
MFLLIAGDSDPSFLSFATRLASALNIWVRLVRNHKLFSTRMRVVEFHPLIQISSIDQFSRFVSSLALFPEHHTTLGLRSRKSRPTSPLARYFPTQNLNPKKPRQHPNLKLKHIGRERKRGTLSDGR